MADVPFLPLFQETRATIRARMVEDANYGLDITDPDYIDVREGSFFYAMTEPVVLELARIWDAMSVEVPSTAFPTYAWGDYLDAHAEALLIERNAATKATGEVRFAATAGTLIPLGTVVTAPEPGEDLDPVSFETTSAVTTVAGISTPTGLSATPSGSGGTLGTDTYSYKVSATTAAGETLPTAVQTAAVTGPTGRVTLDWTDTVGATGYVVYRKATADAVHKFLATTTLSAYSDTGAATPTSRVPVTVETTADAIVAPVLAVEAGIAGNVGANSVTVISSPLTSVTVSNPTGMSGGAEIQDDESLRDEILLALSAPGSGTEQDYRRWVIEYGGIGKVWVEPEWSGAGTVRVIVAGEDGQPVNAGVVTALQTYLDPFPGLGGGKAPIGAVVTVATPTLTTVTVVATIEPLDGYSLDGAGDTSPLRDEIGAAITAYLDGLAVGEDVIYDHIKATLFVEGVYKISAVTVDGGTSDVTISALALARLSAAPTLTEV